MNYSLRLTIRILLVPISNLGAATLYVSPANMTPVPPFGSWDTAATNIQDAVDAAAAGDEIVVTNGVYDTGGRVVPGTGYIPMTITNRVAVDKPLTLRSVNGPRTTTIEGYQLPRTTNGDGAIRCVYLTNGAKLVGFTLTNGATSMGSLLGDYDLFGGGVFGEYSQGATVSNCILANNAAYYGGGGAFQVNLENCLVVSNTCANIEYGYGVGGGGVQGGTITNCTIVGNSGGGALGWYYIHSGVACSLYNSIIYHNQGGDVVGASSYYCCTPDSFLYGVGNIPNEPLFIDLAAGNFRLQSNSPCIDVGTNAYAHAATDLDGRPRIVNAITDIGAYEFQPEVSGLFIGWLQQYGLPTDGSVDYTDDDGDGMNNWQEWIAGTDPMNAMSTLRLLVPISELSGISVRWASISGVTYYLQRTTNLLSAFAPVATDLPGQAGMTRYHDLSATGSGPFFYRVGVQR